jgi:hypothetical protein
MGEDDAMPAKRRAELLTLKWAEWREGERIEAEVSLGVAISAQFKECGGDWTEALRRALESGLRTWESSGSARIVAYVPAALADDFDQCCKEQQSSRSRVLLRRVSRYVDATGEQTDRIYGNRARGPITRRIPGPLKAVQIFAPAEQVRGFDAFCRQSGVKKNGFVAREMKRELDRHARRKAAGSDNESSDTSDPEPITGHSP